MYDVENQSHFDSLVNPVSGIKKCLEKRRTSRRLAGNKLLYVNTGNPKRHKSCCFFVIKIFTAQLNPKAAVGCSVVILQKNPKTLCLAIGKVYIFASIRKQKHRKSLDALRFQIRLETIGVILQLIQSLILVYPKKYFTKS